MKLKDLEVLVLNNLEYLLDTCKGMCGDEGVLVLPEIDENVVLEGCWFCIFRNLLDTLYIDSLSITLGDGSSLEFFRLSDAVVEVGSEAAIVVRADNFLNRVNELVEFNVISTEDADMVIKWFQDASLPARYSSDLLQCRRV